MQGDDGAGEGAHDLPPFEIGRTESGRRRRRPSKTDAAATAVSPKGRSGKPGRPFSSLQPALSYPHQPVIAGKLGERRLAHFADIAPGFDGAQRQINCEVRARNGGMVVDVAEKSPGRLTAVAHDLLALMRFHSLSLGHKAARSNPGRPLFVAVGRPWAGQRPVCRVMRLRPGAP